MSQLKKTMFREYDLRGQVNAEELNETTVQLIGKGFGTYLRRRDINRVVVGYDSRSYSEGLKNALVAGLQTTGIKVFDIGLVLSPILYFAQYHLQCQGGVMITASHNPNGWSGFKLADGYSKTLLSDELQELYKIIEQDDYITGPEIFVEKVNIKDAYLHDVTRKIKFAKPMKVIIDCGNGTAGAFAPDAFRLANAKVGELFCNLDTEFPYHFPNPAEKESRQALEVVVPKVKADIGVCFDGDGDRMGVVDENGDTIWSDRVLILLARHELSRKPGATVVFDVKCTQGLEEDILAHGGKPLMWKTGHSYIKQKLHAIKADLGGEQSGHMFFMDNRGYDDAIFATLRLAEFLSHQDQTLSEVLKTTPQYFTTPSIKAHCADEVKYDIVDKLVEEFKAEYDKVIDINGARVVMEDGWGLVRASSNLPELVLIFEAKTEKRLNEIKDIFRKKLGKFPEIGAWENE